MYAIYFTWDDGIEDTFNVNTAKERDMNIKEMKKSNNFAYIGYCRIYTNGEYGTIVNVPNRRSKYE